MLLSHLVGLLKQDMFHQTFFSQSKTFKVVWREKPLFQTPSFLISYIFNVVQAQKYILILFIAVYKLQVYNITTAKCSLHDKNEPRKIAHSGYI